MTLAQLAYPLIAATEVVILSRCWQSRAQNAAALRMWLVIQLGIFCVLEPTFSNPDVYVRLFTVCTLVSCVADITVLYSIFDGLENRLRAFGSAKAWGTFAALLGLLFCLAGALPMPSIAGPIDTVWLTVVQTFGYIRIASLIALALYGWLRASSWPRDLAWTWLAMALYSFTESIVVRAQIIASNYTLLEVVTSGAALLQLAGWWRALSYSPKPLTQFELQAISVLTSSTYKGSET